MKRFLVMMFSMLLLLTACSPGAREQWGDLKVTLERPQTGPSLWTANLRVDNETNKTQVFQYTGPYRYTIHVSQEGREVYKGSFGKQEPELHNLLPGAGKSHVVSWSYSDQDGKRVSPGIYQVKVELHARNEKAEGGKVAGPIAVEVK